MPWCAPTELPDLRRAGIIARDTETKDDRLRADMGSGWPFKAGYICGVSVAYREGGDIRAHYFPLRHPDSANFDPAQLYQWLRDLIASDVRVVTQNGLYDFGWLRAEADIKMPPTDRLEEIGALATIIDENRYSYRLSDLCTWRGLPGKDDTALQEGATALGLPKRAKPAAHIWQMPARYVGPYAERDAASTLALWENLNPILDREGTRDAYRLEVDLLPMVHEMRRRGIRIDVDAAERARDHLLQKRDAVFAQISEKLGTNVGMLEIGRSKWLAETFDKHGIEYPRTAKGNPSFTAGNSGWMPRHSHWLPPLIVKADKLNNAAVNFLQHYILDHVVDGRIHAEIHPHRSDEGGTRSLRFSYSDPPLQLMPSRNEEITPLIRGVFLPEEGEVWAKPDISQQEFRFIVHYAVKHKLARAGHAADQYRNDPETDFHDFVTTLTGLDRRSAKASNFAKAFGAGVGKFAAMIGKPLSEARKIYNRYDRELPFVPQLAELCRRTADRRGYLELYDGARRHWESWEMLGVAWTKGAGPCSRDEAMRRIADPTHAWHGRSSLRRAETHKAMNALIQGSAARHTKLWMRACWREGIVPLLQMHDSLDCSVATPEQAERVAQLGREAVTLEVPIQVDLKFGRNWANAKHSWTELHQTVQVPQTVSPQVSNGGKVHFELVKVDPIQLPQTKTPRLANLIGQPLVNGKLRCPFHDNDDTPSLHVYPDHFHCFGCGAHGDHIDWLMMIDGMSRDEAIHLLDNWSGPVARAATPESEDASRARKLARALRVWEAAQPICGTLAAHYLDKWRKIDVAALPDDVNTALRFHPHCPFGLVAQPCLIALLRDVATDAPTGIHRIALTPDGNRSERRMLGGSGAVKLWPAGSQLIVGEGIETVLAAATRILHHGAPLRPAWSAVSSTTLSKLPVVPGVEQLVILVDHDLNGQGQAAAARCADRWDRAGRGVTQLKPKRPGDDFNDVIMREPAP